MFRPCIFLLAAIVAWAPVDARKPRVPPDKWAIDYAKEYCILSRDGLAGETGVAFRTRPLSDEHEVMFYKLPGTVPRGWLKSRIHRTDGTTGAERWAFLQRSSGRRQAVIETTLGAEELAEAFSAGAIRVTGEKGVDVQAQLPNVDKALNALRVCEDDLAKRWSVDPVEMRRWAKPATAKSDLRELFWNKDPSRYGVLQSDHVRALLEIDERGRPIACTIVEKSRVEWVNKHVCDVILKEGQFQPALDLNGLPVHGKVVTPRITSARLR